MLNIKLGAKVACTDGAVGEISSVIVDPKTRHLTHYVVKEKESPHAERLVPADKVAEMAHDHVQLNCAKDEFAKMESFAYTEFRNVDLPRYVGDYGYTKKDAPPKEVKRERVPEGERSVRKGFQVQAEDGKVGQVDELFLDEETGELTHFAMREGHLWGKKEVLVPVSAIAYSDQEAVYLKLDKETISSMLAVPVHERRNASDVELMVLTLKDLDQANEALKALKPLTKADGAVLNAAMLVKEADGDTSLKELDDVDRRHGALFGAITGGLVGLVGGPAGVIVGAAAGAVTGGVAAGLIDMGFPDDYLNTLQAEMEPGSAAVVVLVRGQKAHEIADALSGYDGQILWHKLADETVGELGEK
jgi:uncharacterized membrane protein/sporulation protein YlmC with PRC-barrel domain